MNTVTGTEAGQVHVAACIDRPPAPLLDAVDLENDLVEVPLVGWPGPFAPDFCGDLRPELRNPDPDRLMGHDNPALREKILYIAQAQGEAVICPDGVANDGPRKAMPFEAGEIIEVQHPRGLPSARGAINLTMPFDPMSLDPFRKTPTSCAVLQPFCLPR